MLTASPEHDPFAGPAIAAVVPTTDPQREIWAATRLSDAASLAFNEAVTVRLRGPLDRDALRAAVHEVVARHDALRSVITEDGTSLVVHEAGEVAYEEHAWSEERVARAAREPFDLAQGPLARFELLRVADDEHVLLIAAHHVVCDGWSFGVLLGDLAAAYSARRDGVAPSFDGATSFSDHARAAQSDEARAARSEAEAFWARALATAPAALDLPLDRVRPPRRTHDSARVDHVLSAPLVRDVAAAGARGGASLYATLVAGFGALLHRLTGQDDLVVGIPAAGQAALGTPSLVGHCVSMLPLRLTVGAAAPFAGLATSARGALLDALEHQSVSLGTLLARLPAARDASRPPLVGVAFNLEREPAAGAPPFRDLSTEVRTVPRVAETFELFVNAVERGGAIVLECQYNTALFDEATVARWLASYERLLASAAARPETPVESLALRTAADDAVDASGAVDPLPAGPTTVAALLNAGIARDPHAVAVESDAGTLTYAELDTRANRLAHRLRREGVRRGARVGLCVPRTPDMLVALVAVLRAGGAYVPLDPDYPADRLALMAHDAGLDALVTVTPLVHRVQTACARVLLDDSSLDAEPASPLAPDERSARAHDAAYVIYTSGSTGTPKGVVVPNEAAANLLRAVAVSPGLAADDVVLAITTLSFDIALAELVLPLTVGARVVLATRDQAADGASLRALIERHRVTFVDATPATYRLLLAAGWTGAPHVRAVCTGEAMPLDLARALLPRVGALWNAYGPTETTVWATCWRVTAPVDRVRIGTPVAGLRASVRDRRGALVPTGAVGELYVSGVGVASGYHARPELTVERFVTDAQAPNGRTYRTGDFARRLADGSLECLGRADHQVKLRGYRVELGEIEAALGWHVSVRHCVVVAREDRPGDTRLVAYVVGDDVEADTLRAHLRRTLPEYMVPAAFVRLARLPLSPSGKVDRRALPAPDAGEVPNGSNGAPRAAFVAPRTPTERAIAALWARTLGVPRASVHDDFFALGGHSLLASQLLARLRRDHGVEVAFRTIFEAPTIAQLAAEIDAVRAAAAAADVRRAELVPRGPLAAAPLSLLQERVWRLEEMNERSAPAHVHTAAWRLRGALDDAALDRAVQAFADRQPIMRTSFHVVDGERVQRVAPHATATLARLDLSSLAPDGRERRLEALNADGRALDLSTSPPRATLVRLTDVEHVLFVAQHAMIWDGWSFDVFLAEVAELYAADVEGRAPSLPPLPVAYADFAVWQRERLAGPELAPHVAWWRERLDGELPVLALPTDRPRGAAATFAGGRVECAFTAQETDAVRAVARRHGVTPFVVFLALYEVLLHRWTGQRELIVGTPTRGRARAELEHVAGPFVNTLPLRLRVDPAQSFAELLAAARDVSLDAFSRAEIPVELLGHRPPTLRAILSMQDARDGAERMGALAVEPWYPPERHAATDLTLWAKETGAELRVVMHFNADLFDPTTAARMLAQFRRLLAAAAENAEVTVSELPLLDDSERDVALGTDDPARPSLAEQLGLSSDDTIVSALSLLDPSAPCAERLAEACGAALVALVALDEADADDPDTLAEHLRDATVGVAPLDRWRDLASIGWRPPATLRCVVSDGECVEPSAIVAAFPAGARVFVATGSTSGHGWLLVHTLVHALDAPGTLSAGAPLGGSRLAVLDALGHPAPLGVVGRLHVATDGGSLAPTGLVARRAADGTIAVERSPLTTRRGVPLPLRAIENALGTHPSVADAAVTVHDADGFAQVVAYVVVRPGAVYTDTELRARVRAALPASMAPQAIVRCSALPEGDAAERRARLATPYSAAGDDARREPPRTDAERALAAIWCELLGVAAVARDDNFFALGGFSLLCFRAIDRVERLTGVRLSPRAFLVGTLAQVALPLDGAAWRPTPLGGAAVHAPRTTDGQRRGWLRTLLGKSA